MISETSTYRVVCDRCKRPAHMLSVHSRADAVMIATKLRWTTTDDGEHYCPECTQHLATIHTRTDGQCLVCGQHECATPSHVEYSRDKRAQRRLS